MKIIYISSTPSGMRSQSIYFDLMQEFVRNGHDVYCVYAEEKRNNQDTHTFTENNITYLGVKTGNLSKNPNLISKGIATLMIDKQYRKAIDKYWGSKTFDLVLYSTPPITFVETLKYFKNRKETIYLMLKDIFPQNAVDLKMFKENSLLHKFFMNKEKVNYELSDYIGVMSPANKDFLLNSYPNLVDKVEVLPNAIKINDEKKVDITRKELGLPENDIIYLYGGNIGKPQSPEFIIECIEKIETIEGAKFVICGWGAETSKIVNYIEEHQIKNTLYLGQKSVETFNQITSLSDVGLIFLDYKFTIPNFPQRLLSYMEAQLPVICATDESTDMGRIAESNDFGYFVPSNDSQAWLDKVVILKDESILRDTMGKNGYTYLKNNYDVRLSYDLIMKQIKE